MASCGERALRRLAGTAPATGSSAFLVAAIHERDQQLRDITDQLLAGGTDSIDARLSDIRSFVTQSPGNLRTPIQEDYIRPAGWCLVECPQCGAAAGIWCQNGGTPKPNGGRLPIHKEVREAAGRYEGEGWHTFRHTRSWLDDTGAPVGVQQKLMRHPQVSITMNVYGNALMGAKREANSKVVRMALRSA
jgi:hypothetical protein